MKGQKNPHQLSIKELIQAVQHPTKEINAGRCLFELRDRYLPLIKSLTSRLFVRGMDFEDWLQEAVFIMIKAIRIYSLERRTRFSSLYKRCLSNWFNDIVRKGTAKKRIPSDRLTSYDANQIYYEDVLMDVRAVHPERAILTNDSLQTLIYCCSHFEKVVVLSVIIHHQSPKVIAKQNHCSVSSVKSAFARCTTKFRDLQDRGLN